MKTATRRRLAALECNAEPSTGRRFVLLGANGSWCISWKGGRTEGHGTPDIRQNDHVVRVVGIDVMDI